MLEKALLLLLVFISCQADKKPDIARISIQAPTAEAEATYVWSLLGDVPFFEANGYDLSLPDHPLMDSLIARVKSNRLNSEDSLALMATMRDDIFDATDYQAGMDKVTEQMGHLNSMINRLDEAKRSWSFQHYETYQLAFTLYGPGGSYNPDAGSILLYTTPQGDFKSYNNPANTIIHEIVHIGIENSIIGPNEVPHPLKERLVDHIVLLRFGKELPTYRMQPMGDPELDQFFQDISALEDLPQTLQAYLTTAN